ncbi:hypothetical protein ACI2OX_01300 [Bacillus sp. N9]
MQEIQLDKKMIDYDIVISTVRLPFSNIDYILVSPLLNEENIEAIRSYLANNIGKLTKKGIPPNC